MCVWKAKNRRNYHGLWKIEDESGEKNGKIDWDENKILFLSFDLLLPKFVNYKRQKRGKNLPIFTVASVSVMFISIFEERRCVVVLPTTILIGADVVIEDPSHDFIPQNTC